jgi:hypothetical protein
MLKIKYTSIRQGRVEVKIVTQTGINRMFAPWKDPGDLFHYALERVILISSLHTQLELSPYVGDRILYFYVQGRQSPDKDLNVTVTTAQSHRIKRAVIHYNKQYLAWKIDNL